MKTLTHFLFAAPSHTQAHCGQIPEGEIRVRSHPPAGLCPWNTTELQTYNQVSRNFLILTVQYYIYPIFKAQYKIQDRANCLCSKIQCFWTLLIGIFLIHVDERKMSI